MKIKKGDNVLVLAGNDKGKAAKILKAFPKERKILVEGVNLKKRHVKPRKEGEQGQVIPVPMPLDISNVKIICPKCGKPTRIGYKIEKDRKFRVCKKCSSEI